jgi:hypothetical protein
MLSYRTSLPDAASIRWTPPWDTLAKQTFHGERVPQAPRAPKLSPKFLEPYNSGTYAVHRPGRQTAVGGSRGQQGPHSAGPF